jgi:hypothetical protein
VFAHDMEGSEVRLHVFFSFLMSYGADTGMVWFQQDGTKLQTVTLLIGIITRLQVVVQQWLEQICHSIHTIHTTHTPKGK